MKKVKVEKGGKFEVFYKLWRKTLEGGLFLYSEDSVRFIIDEELPNEFLRTEIETGNKYLFLAYIDNKPAGYLLTNKTKGGIAFGHWLGVDSQFQRQGIASALLSSWEKDALREGAHKLQLWTTKNNVSFYKNRGFTKGGNFPDSWFGEDHFLFYKTLRKSDEKIFLRDFLKKRRG